jgi:hypothetical protein
MLNILKIVPYVQCLLLSLFSFLRMKKAGFWDHHAVCVCSHSKFGAFDWCSWNLEWFCAIGGYSKIIVVNFL